MLIMMSLNARCSINTAEFVVVADVDNDVTECTLLYNTIKFVVVVDVDTDVAECTLFYKHSRVCCGC